MSTTDDGESEAQSEAEAEAEATLRIVRGEPTPEELAALVAVLSTRAGSGGAAAAPPAASAWTDRSRYVRPRLGHTPDGWRASAYPQ